MTLLQVVKQYVAEGHKVGYRVRSDGGIIITSVDGMKFTKVGEGNRYLRTVTGANLSAARMEQTKYNVAKFIKLDKSKGQKKASSKGDTVDLKKLTKKVQREWRKNATVGEGKVTIRKVRWYAKEHGEAYARDYLERRMKYSQGWAYEENVYYWEGRLKKLGLKEEARALKRNALQTHQKLLNDIHDILYNHALTREEQLRQIKELVAAEYN